MMTTIALVVAAAENNVIGREGVMPWHLPADLAHFKRITMGKPIVMGRRTFETLGRALPGRRNIVVSLNAKFTAPGIERAASMEMALTLAGDVEEVMVIGGGLIYLLALPLAQRIYLTRVHTQIDGDTFFPNIDLGEWREVAREERDADDRNVYALTFLILERKQVSSN
ncbi:MAG: type 3 dihydrofolate reductase [Gammaproteobacteria bacterium]